MKTFWTLHMNDLERLRDVFEMTGVPVEIKVVEDFLGLPIKVSELWPLTRMQMYLSGTNTVIFFNGDGELLGSMTDCFADGYQYSFVSKNSNPIIA